MFNNKFSSLFLGLGTFDKVILRPIKIAQRCMNMQGVISCFFSVLSAFFMPYHHTLLPRILLSSGRPIEFVWN